MERNVKISVVVPVYGCPGAIKPLYERLVKTINIITKSYEIIFVNDGCPKNSWQGIKEICKNDKKVIGINLSRNFGQLHSTNAGIDYASGDYIVSIDCDLQDPPEAIFDLYNEIDKGYDVVFAKRKNRKDSKLTILFSKLFYKVYNRLVDGYYDGDIGNFCIVKKEIVEEYKKINDKNKSFTTVLSWMGYNTKIIDIESDERYEGKSSYTFSKKLDLAIDMLTSQSNKPLKIVVYIGMIIAFASFIYLLVQIVKYLVLKNITEGWTSIIGAVFLMGGIMLISIGCVGIYIGNIFNQTKGNPEYLIKEIINKK